MIIQRFITEGLGAYAYLMGDNATRKAVVINPSRDVESILNFAKAEKLSIQAILETHVPTDFISGSPELKSRLGGKSLIYSSSTPHYADSLVRDGDEINLGTTRLKALHTPGPSKEHLVWLGFEDLRSKDVPCIAFTGDLLLVGGVGRPDFFGEEERAILSKQLYHSLFTTLDSVPDFVEILPAHGIGALCLRGLSSRKSSTIGYEKQFNPFLKKKPEEQWIENLGIELGNIPSNYRSIMQTNLSGPKLLSELGGLTKSADTTFLDVRNPEAFSKGHIKGSLNIPINETFMSWALAVLDGAKPLTIVHDNHMVLPLVVKSLCLIGFDKFSDYLFWEELPHSGHETEKLDTVSINEIIENPESYYILDVRTPSEWNKSHIPGAHHNELVGLKEGLERIPHNQPIRTICGTGYRSSIAASLLKKAGFKDVANIVGGMRAWEAQEKH